MALIDVVQWKGTPNIFAYKFPETNLTTLTQLIVYESQEAYLYHKGKIIQKFEAGKHTLSTENIPLLENLYGIPFGGNNPFTAEVWFVNKSILLDIKWGTQTPINLMDPKFKIMVPVRGFGQFGIQIKDGEKFLVKLVGVLPSFNQITLSEYLRGVLQSKISAIIAQKITAEKICILEIAAHISNISDNVKNSIAGDFAEFGIEIINFFVNSINVPDDDEAVMRLKSLLSKKAEMDILGFSYQEERSYNVLDNASSNEGTVGGLVGAGVGLGMGMSAGGYIGHMMSNMIVPNAGEIKSQDIPNIACPECATVITSSTRFCPSCGRSILREKMNFNKKITCDKCQKEIPNGAKFCPHCGDTYNPCSKCGFDNPQSAIQCGKCGEIFPIECKKCGKPTYTNMKFCPNCGNSQIKLCRKCKVELQPNTKFCFECGTKNEDI